MRERTVIRMEGGFFEHDGVRAGVTIRVPDGRPPRSCVLYLHGGGLLYGERDDLPEAYAEMLLSDGHALVCADYPLAPETGLAEIHAFINALWDWCAETTASCFGTEHLFVFGRSAGAYLALTLAGRLSADRGRAAQPAGVIDFYGYDDPSDPALAEPSDYYRTYPPVSEEVVRAIVCSKPVSSGPKALRFALYAYARQRGAWLDLMGTDESEAASFKIPEEAYGAMPPVFYAASTADRDVPYALSKRLARKLGASIATVYGKEHDFDRDGTDPDATDVYRKLIAWMDARLV